MTWRLWWPYAGKIVQRQSSSRHGWFKRHRSRHRPPTRGGWRLRCLHLFQFPRKGPRTCSRNRIRRRQSAILKADSGSAEELRAAVASAAEAFGILDIFVSNAGILTRGTIDTYALEDFDRMVAINVRAAFVGIQAAAQEMNDGGRIVIIGSNTAIRTAFPGASVYSMTKAALVGLVRGAAIDLAPRAITVNNVQPGPTTTDMSSAHAES